jgi:hypothetical protein
MTINVFRNMAGGGDGGGKGRKVDLYIGYLRSEGYLPEVDGDGDVVFKMEGGSYVLFAHEDDREYFSILFPNFWPIESEQERSSAYVAACHATATTKVAKVYVVRDNVSASVELIFGDPEQFKPVFRRAMAMLRGSVGVFAEKMRETG